MTVTLVAAVVMLVSLLLSVDEADKSRRRGIRLEKRTIIFGFYTALGDFRHA